MNDVGTSDLLVELAANDILEARQKGLEPAELQIDFDCPESQLNDYAKWIAVLRDRLAPVPVTITVLPCWLVHSSFAAIARLAPNFVLQVHSLERPTDAATMKPLCEPQKALAWVSKAAQFGVPFRVALPTCGYRVAFDRTSGRFAGLIAEGPSRRWSPTIESRELAPQADEMARLIRELNLSHPIALTGVIWYRLPVEGDTLNWAWPTLTAVMQGRTPKSRVETEVVQSGGGLFEVRLSNTGDSESNGDVYVKVEWNGQGTLLGSGEPNGDRDQPLASEGLASFETISEASDKLIWKGQCRLKPGKRQIVGWVRFANELEVRAHVSSNSF